MAEIDHEKIRVVAYELWERDGAPEGKDDEYWHAAVKLLSDEGEVDEGGVDDPDDPVPVVPIVPLMRPL